MAKYTPLNHETTFWPRQYVRVNLTESNITYEILPPTLKDTVSAVLLNSSIGAKASINWGDEALGYRRHVEYKVLRDLIGAWTKNKAHATLSPFASTSVCIPRAYNKAILLNQDISDSPAARLHGFWVMDIANKTYLLRFDKYGALARFKEVQMTRENPTPAPRKRGRPRKNP